MGAEHIFVQGGGGTVVIKLDLPLHEATAEQLKKGYLRRVNEDGSPYVEPAEDGGPAGPKRPARSDNKPEWVGWAVAAFGVTPDDAEAMTKQDLIDRYDKDPEPAGPVTPPAE